MKKTILKSGLIALTMTTALVSPVMVAHGFSAQQTVTSSVQATEALLLPWPRATEIYNQAIIRDGNSDQAIRHLLTGAADLSRSLEQRTTSLRLASLIHWKGGRMDKALELAGGAAALLPDGNNLYLLAKLRDASGEVKAAVSVYERALSKTPSKALAYDIRLQLALIKAMDNDVAPLMALAKDGDRAQKNRMAITMGLLQFPEEALGLYELESGNGRQATIDHMRMAAWAIKAENPERAKIHAWRAAQGTKVRAERLYAFSLLVEAHRKDNSLEMLITTFSVKKDLSIEAREVWIDLLHEMGKSEEALALFKSSGNGGFRPEERIKLIGMYQANGDHGAIVNKYETLIKAEPHEVYWYMGLSEYYAVKGLDRKAEVVWLDFIKASPEPDVLLAGAHIMSEMGFDDKAVHVAEMAMTASPSPTNGLVFLFEHYLIRGQIERARSTLVRRDKYLPAGSADRLTLAESYERIGDVKEALAIWEDLIDYPAIFGVDEKMRLAWMYRSQNREEDAWNIWQELAQEKLSPAVRGIVEQQMITMSAELGILGEVAYDLEEKLASGKATGDESSFLARIYIRVEDKVSVIEIIDEYFKSTGADEVDSLLEHARVYLLMGDFVSHGKTFERLMELDPDNKPEYLRNLILGKVNLLGQGATSQNKITELKALLAELIAVDGDATGRQFEGGTLALAGLDEEAVAAFQKAIAQSGNNGDLYLQLGSLFSKIGQTEKTVALFQALAEESQSDEMFVVAIDGILNSIGAEHIQRRNSQERTSFFNWLQRIVYARLTQREDKFFYYKVLADVVSETGDEKAQVGILDGSLAIAKNRRTTVLRELISMTTSDDTVASIFYGIKKNQNISRIYGHRLVGLREALPPSVYMNLAASFIEDKNPFSAEKSVNKAVEESGQIQLRSDAGSMFEKSGYDYRAIEQYRKALIRNQGNFELMVNVARLREKVGQDQSANELFGRSLEILLSRQLQIAPLGPKILVEDFGTRSIVKDNDKTQTRDYKKYYTSILQGFMTTWQDNAEIMEARLSRFEKNLLKELAVVSAFKGDKPDPIEKYARLNYMGIFLRDVSLAVGDYVRADRIDGKLIRQFSHDENFMIYLLSTRFDRGLVKSASHLTDLMRNRNASLGLIADVVRKIRLVGHAVSFKEQLNAAIESKNFDVLLNTAFTSGEQSKILAALRVWAEGGFYLEAFKWSRDNLDAGNHKNISQYIIKLVRKDNAFLKKVFLNDYKFLSNIEAVTSKDVLTINSLVLLIKSDASGILERTALPYLVSRFSQEELLAYLEEKLISEAKITPMQIIILYWGDIIKKPWDKKNGNKLAQLIIDVFDKTKKYGGEFKNGNVTMHTGESLSNFKGHIMSSPIIGKNLFWVKKVVDSWRSHMNDSFDILAPSILLNSGKSDEAINVFIDMTLSLMTDKDKGSKLRSFISYNAQYVFPEYINDLRENIRLREKKYGSSEALTDFNYYLFFTDIDTYNRTRVEFVKQAAFKHPLNPKYAAMKKIASDHEWLPWQSLEGLKFFQANDPKNLFYRGALFLALIRADRLNEAMALNGIGSEDMLADGYFNNLRNMALKFGLNLNQHVDHPYMTPGFNTGLTFVARPIDPANDPVNIILQKIATAVAEGDEVIIRNQLRALWQTVMQISRPVWKTSAQFEIEKISKYKRIINLDWLANAGPDHQGRKLFDVMADYDFSIKEFESFIRAKRVNGDSGLNELYIYLVKAYERQGLAEDKFQDLTRKLQLNDGEMTQDEFIFWLNFADRRKEILSQDVLKGLDGWHMRRNLLHVTVLNLMARQYVSTGQDDRILSLYKEIADHTIFMHFPSMQDRGKIEYLYSHEGRMTTKALMKEGMKVLGGDQRISLLNYIIDRMNSFVGKDKRLQQMADLFILQNLPLALNPEQIADRLKKSDREMVHKHPLNALNLTGLLAKSGELELARDSLRRMVGLFSKLRSMSIAELQGNFHGNSREGKIGQVFAEVLGFSIPELIEKNPVILSDIYAPVPKGGNDKGWRWLIEAGDVLADMLNERGIDRGMIVEMMADLARRLERGGKADEVARVLSHLSDALKVKAFNAKTIKAIYALSREMNMPLDIATSKMQLAEGLLDKRAILETIRRTREGEGDSAALQLAEKAAEYTRFDSLLGLLIDLSQGSGQTQKAESWTAERVAADKLRDRLKQVADTAPEIPIH